MFWYNLIVNILWVLLGGGFLALFKISEYYYMDRFGDNKIGKWFSKQTVKTYQIFPPTDNTRSFGEMEDFFVSMYSIFSEKSTKDIFITGKWHESIVFNIFSQGGKVGFFVNINSWYENVIRASLEGHFPGSRLVEVDFIMNSWPSKWNQTEKKNKDKENNNEYWQNFDIYGTDVVMSAEDIHPLKPWQKFQNENNQPIVDPIIQLVNILENIPKEDYAMMQISLVPRNHNTDNTIDGWKKSLQELKNIMITNDDTEVDELGQVQALTKEEREVLNQASNKIAAVNHRCKLRFGYFSASTKIKPSYFEKDIRAFIKEFSTNYQNLKIDQATCTRQDAKGNYLGLLGPYIGKFLDEFYWEREQEYRKYKMYASLKGGSQTAGYQLDFTSNKDFTGVDSRCEYYDVCSLASIFHFPVVISRGQGFIQKVSQLHQEEEDIFDSNTPPPSNLPV